MRFMNLLGLRQVISDRALQAGSDVKLAKELDVSHSHLSAVKRGDAKPGNKLLKALGFKVVIQEKKNAEMKFEDITN